MTSEFPLPILTYLRFKNIYKSMYYKYDNQLTFLFPFADTSSILKASSTTSFQPASAPPPLYHLSTRQHPPTFFNPPEYTPTPTTNRK